jgi:hypothetical protein
MLKDLILAYLEVTLKMSREIYIQGMEMIIKTPMEIYLEILR